MKVELHCHTCRYSGCSRTTPAELMERLIRFGYEAVYITEHDAVWSDWEIAQLQEGFPEIRIFPGVELSVGEEFLKHIVVLGTTDRAYLKLRDEQDILDEARGDGHLTVLAHPFRWPGGAEMLEGGLLPDALEYRTCNHDAYDGLTAREMSERYELPLVNAGDTHGLDFLDRYWIETHRPIHNADDIRAIVLEGAYRNCVGEGDR